MAWTLFWDMHSGGGTKEPPYTKIYIEAPIDEAKVIFYNRFGHNPQRVTCTCCGDDYSIDESPTLAQASAYHRDCQSLDTPRDEDGLYQDPDDPWFKEHYWIEDGEEDEALRRGYSISTFPRFGKYQTVEEYIKNPDVLVIRDDEIQPGERVGSVPEQGYVWAG